MKKVIYVLSLGLSTLMLFGCDKAKDETPTPDPNPTPNKIPVVLSNLTAETTLTDIFTDDTPDYYVNEDIAIAAKLTIRPGVIIEVAADKKITFRNNSTLVANGEPGAGNIVFRGKTKEPGFWRGIVFETRIEANVLNHVRIAHTGSSSLLSGKKAALALFGNTATHTAILTLKNSVVSDNAGYGLFVEEMARLQEFAGNKFERNALGGIVTSANQVHKIDAATQFTNNGVTDVDVYTSNIEGTGELLWPKLNYRVTGVNGLIVKGGWKITPGALLEFADYTQVRVENLAGAYLNAVGTATDKIIFTGVKKEKGAWKGISIYSKNDQNKIQHAKVEYGGNGSINGKKANIYVLSDNKLTVRDTKISHSSGYGLYLSNAAIFNTDIEQVNEFEQNTQGVSFKE